LATRARVEGDADVRAAIAETIGRLPYGKAAQAEKAEQVLLDMDARGESVTDRLGAIKGLEALGRISKAVRPLSDEAITLLKRAAAPAAAEAATGARVRRLAIEALVGAGNPENPANWWNEIGSVVTAAATDKDAQVRRIAMRAAPPSTLLAATHDDSPIVRFEALRQLKAKNHDATCAASLEAISDRVVHVALLALDQLAICGSSTDAVAALDRAVTDLSDAGSPRGWHRAAHALAAMATASPERARAVLGQFTGSSIWQLRVYAARAAAALRSRDVLEALAADNDDNVREAAVEALSKLAGHDADTIYIAQLSRSGYQVIRAAARALAGTPARETAVPALNAALDRLVAEGRDNSHDAREAIANALRSVGVDLRVDAHGNVRGSAAATAGRTRGSAPAPANADLNADDLRRLASPRARITIRGIGVFELALFTVQAPATVLRFAHLAESGYYNGLTFHRVVPNFVIQGGSTGANEYIGDARFMRDELGLWPHVRGAAGISTRGRDTGDAQIFIDLVDNPRLDHEYTVFAQILNGIEVVDQILEGDVIERVEILP